jgi:hypothetical protein
MSNLGVRRHMHPSGSILDPIAQPVCALHSPGQAHDLAYIRSTNHASCDTCSWLPILAPSVLSRITLADPHIIATLRYDQSATRKRINQNTSNETRVPGKPSGSSGLDQPAPVFMAGEDLLRHTSGMDASTDSGIAQQSKDRHTTADSGYLGWMRVRVYGCVLRATASLELAESLSLVWLQG